MLKAKLFLLFFTIITMISPLSAVAGRPLAIDDAYPIQTSEIEVEGGFLFWHRRDIDNYEFPFAVGYGLIEDFELGAGFGHIAEEFVDENGHAGTRRGLGDLNITCKWKILDHPGIFDAVSISPGIKLPTANEHKGMSSGETDYNLTLILSTMPTEETGAHINVGYWLVGKPENDEAYNSLH